MSCASSISACLAMGLAVACDPGFREGSACGAGGECPPGQECNPDGFCYEPGDAAFDPGRDASAADAPPIDAADASPDPGDPDAMWDAGAPSATRSGRIVIVDTRVTNDLSSLGVDEVSGALVQARYADLTQPGIAPVVGSGQLGECTVWVHDVGTSSEPVVVDEGRIRIRGATPDPLPDCVFRSGGYRCLAYEDEPVAAGSSVSHAVTSGIVRTRYRFAGESFGSTLIEPVGMHLLTEGFGLPANNGLMAILGYNPAFPDRLRVLNPAAVRHVVGGGSPGQLDETVPAGAATFSIVAGAGPIVGGFDFLDDGTSDIIVEKTDGPVVDAFSVTLHAAGEGWELAPGSATPDALPSSAQDVEFACDDCGPDPDSLTAFLVSGRTTDGDLSATFPVEMPAPLSQYAVFECTAVASSSITIPADAMAAILGTSPTRAEVQVSRLSATFVTGADGTDTTAVAAGHGLLGYTDF